MSVKNTQRPLKWNNHDLVCYSPKRNFPKTQLKMSPRRYTLKEIHIISRQNLTTNRAEGSLKTKIDPFWKDRSTRYCFEPLFKIRKIQKVYQCNFALNHLKKNWKSFKKVKLTKRWSSVDLFYSHLLEDCFLKFQKSVPLRFCFKRFLKIVAKNSQKKSK